MITYKIYFQDYNRLDELEESFQMFKEEHQAHKQYSILLSAIKRNTDDDILINLYNDAFNANKYVPYYLTGKNKIPKREPIYYSLGDKNEAIYYARLAHDAWNDDEIAMEKLKELVK